MENLIMNAVLQELKTAEQKHPDWPDDIIHQVSIMNEEAGEAIKAAIEYTYEDQPYQEIEKEIIQTAAMCLRILKHI